MKIVLMEKGFDKEKSSRDWILFDDKNCYVLNVILYVHFGIACDLCILLP